MKGARWLWLLCHAVSCAVLSIDYGTEWTKAALVKPGIPLEIVLTKDTKRKEQSVIAFKGNERLYGGDAANMAARVPKDTFPALKTLLGQAYDSEAAREYSALYPAAKLVKTNRSTVAFEHGEYNFSVEELVAMEFINMRKNAELMADGGVRDTILTVPPYFDQAQRAALIAAAELAGLKPLELLNDGLAVALDYAKARTFDEPQMHVIFDMGAGSTSATVVKFVTQSVKDVGRFNKTVTKLEVLATDYSTEVSGNVMSERLYAHLVKTFDESGKAQSSITTSPRALARLLREATRIKQVLSANNEATVSVESLHDDHDFKHKITRAQFETLVADLGDLTSSVVRDALNLAQLNANDIDSLILHGGAARVPFVQQALLNVVTEEKIARNVNADEAAVMGSVFRGAGLSGSFRVKDLQLQDSSLVSYKYVTPKDQGLLFDRMSNLGLQKNVSVKDVDGDFDFTITSTGLGKAQTPYTISSYRISGVEDATTSLSKDFGCQSPEVVISVSLSQSGMIVAHNANVTCEIEERQGVAGKLKGWFGGKEANSATQSDSPRDTNTTDAAPIDKKTQKNVRVTLKRLSVGSHILDSAERQDSLRKIRIYEEIDADRIARETARNGLEAYIYKVRDFLENDSFLEVSSTEERKNLQVLSAAANEWMYADGESAATAELQAKKQSMADIASKIHFRKKEHEQRDDKTGALQKQISSSRAFIKSQLQEIKKYTTALADRTLKKKRGPDAKSENERLSQIGEQPDADDSTKDVADEQADDELPEPLYKEAELNTFEEKLDQVDDWLSAKLQEQKEKSRVQDPVLLTADLELKTTQVTDSFMALLRKATYRGSANSRTKSQAKTKSKTSLPKSNSGKTHAKSETSKSATKPEATSSHADTKPEDPESGSMPEPDVEDVLSEAPKPEPEAVPEPGSVRDEL